jgi:DNA-binding Xre family transcriptional regulator
MDQKKFKQLYKSILIAEDMTQKDLALKNDMTPNSLQQKINRGTIRFIEFVTLMESMGYTVKFEKEKNV